LLANVLTWFCWEAARPSAYGFFYVAVAFSAWRGGLGPGLFATVLSALSANVLFTPPFLRFSVDPDSLLRTGLFLLLTVLITAFFDERKRVAEADRRLRRWYEGTLAGIGDAVVLTNTAHQITDLNAVAESLTGWPKTEAIGRPIEDVIRLLDVQNQLVTGELVVQVIHTGEVQRLGESTTLARRDRSTVSVEGLAAPIRDDQGALVGAVLIVRDNAEREQAQRALRERESRYRLLFERNQAGVLHIANDGRILDCNNSCARILGFPGRDKVTAHNLLDLLVHAEEREVLVDRLRGTPGLSDDEICVRRTDGSPAWVLATVAPLEGERGKAEYLMTIVDVTGRKQAEDAQRFLAEAGRVLSSSLSYETTFENLAQLALPRLADLCLIDVQNPDGSIRRVAAAHALASKRPLAEALRRFPPDPAGAHPAVRVLQTGRAEFCNEIDFDSLAAGSRDAEHIAIIRELNFQAYLVTPLVARGRNLGMINLIRTETRRPFDDVDLALARELADRAALAVDNARLYGEAQEALLRRAESMALTDALLNATPIAVAVFDREFRHIRVNQVIADISGIPMEAHLGRSMREVYPEEADRYEPILRHVIETGEPILDYPFEGDATARGGRRGHWLANFCPVKGPDGSPIGVGVMVIDVTEAKHAEEALRASESRFRELADAMPQIVWTAKADGQVDYFNRRWYEYTGLPDDWVISIEELASMLHPDDLLPSLTAWADAVTGKRTFELECRYHAGGDRWHLVRAEPVCDDSGRIVRWIGTATDIDDRVRAEKALDVANRAKDRFLAVLSHELRTPLTPVLVEVSAMLDDPDTPQSIRPALEVARRNIELEARLIDDLLDVTHIRQGKLRLERTVVNAHELVGQALEICRDEIAAANLELTVDLAATERHIDADPGRIQQVVWNLVKNAVKFSSGGGKLTVRTRNASCPASGAAAGRLRIEVADTGVGIESARLPKIFNAFEQGQDSTSQQFGGLGLGLAISKSLAEAHGGTLTAASPGEGQGATFTLDLAVVPAPSADDVQASPDRRTPLRPESLQILFVEDNADTLRVMTRLLRARGHRVSAATDVASALKVLETGAPLDLVISDIGLPDGSGLEVMREVRERSQALGIAFSGYAMKQDIEQSQQAGFVEHLTKPINFAMLESAIARVMLKRDRAPENPCR
jgi:PAS domain S-box-containing protein